MTAILELAQSYAPDILQALANLIAAASILANFTRTDADNKALAALDKLVNFLAANFFALGGKK